MGHAAPLARPAGQAPPAGPQMYSHRSRRPSTRAQADAVAGLTVDAPRQLQLEQRGLHVRRRCIALADQFVNRERRRAQRRQQPLGQRARTGAGARRRAPPAPARRGLGTRAERARRRLGRAPAAAPGSPARRRRSRPDGRRRAAAGWCRDGAGPAGCPAPPSPRGRSRAPSRAVISEPEAGAASTTTTPERQAGDHPVAAREVLGAGRRPPAAAR